MIIFLLLLLVVFLILTLYSLCVVASSADKRIHEIMQKKSDAFFNEKTSDSKNISDK